MQAIQAIRGMKDILADEIWIWQRFEAVLRHLMQQYSYREIRMPLVEKTELFKRSIGEVTDIVEKEMYTFLDRNGDSLSLRPEGTAQCVRLAIEHGLLRGQTHRWWYMGPMFRHERPQKGRYRQFYQLGVEAFGMEGPQIDAEQILMMARLLKDLKIAPWVTLQINSLGTREARQHYRQELVHYFERHLEALDEDSQRRLKSNPLRILDSKNADMADLIKQAPKLLDYLDKESLAHFEDLQSVLREANCAFEINPRLVRGLDYYSKTVFEFVTDKLGAQGTICAGGRYDGLVTQMGGQSTPAVGFAMGLDRIIALLEHLDLKPQPLADVYVVLLGEKAQMKGLAIGEQLRQTLPELKIMTHCQGGGVKSQFKKADKSGAKVALVIGEDEIKDETYTLKYLRSDQEEQQKISFESLVTMLSHLKDED